MIWVEMKMYGFLFQKGHLLASPEGKILLPALPSALLSCSLSESPSVLSCVPRCRPFSARGLLCLLVSTVKGGRCRPSLGNRVQVRRTHDALV